MRLGLILAVAIAATLSACTPPKPRPEAIGVEEKSADAPPPAAVPLAPISCKADRNLACSGAGCESTLDDFIQVQLTFDPQTGSGSLCTFTYCRGVALLSMPSAEGPDRLSGLIISAASGSTEPASEQPTADFALTIAPDLKTFALMGFADGRFGGYGGPCEPASRE